MGLLVLERIKGLFKEEIKEVENRFAEVFSKSHSPTLREVGGYIVSSGGKRIRPVLTFLSGYMLGADRQSLVKIATSIELIHNATLLHDDVIDNSSLRRGRETVKKRWGEDVAILVADYLFSNAFDIVLEILKPEILKGLTSITSKMCEGELFQLEKKQEMLSINDYYKIIDLKTSLLFSAATSLSAISVNSSSKQINDLSEFGLLLGRSFQITDDILDYTGTKKNHNKDIGKDLAEGKQTMPLIYTLEKANEKDSSSIKEILNNGRDFNLIMDYIKRYEGIEYSLREAKNISSRATRLLGTFEKNSYSDILVSLPEDICKRVSDFI